MTTMPQRSQKAIVIGSGMAGLMTARVLSDYFARVEIFERDPPVTKAEARPGVPQGRQIHTLLARGQRVLEALFPGFEDSVLKAGGKKGADVGTDLKMFAFGHWMPDVHIGAPQLTMTRGLLEFVVRERVTKIANVRFRYDTTADELVLDKAMCRVAGVVARTGAGAPVTVDADFIVDAAGRGAFGLRSLTSRGVASPPEDLIGLDFGYATAAFDIPWGFQADWGSIYLLAQPPQSRGAFFCPIEGSRWLVTAFGRGKSKPPAQFDAFMDFLRQLPHPIIYNCIKHARLTSDIKLHWFPSSLQRRYDQLTDHPEGFLAIGDAICSFNPVFAQGMSMAAMEVEALNRRLRARTASGQAFDGLWREFYEEARQLLATPWAQTLLVDSLYDETRMPRPFGFALRRRMAFWAQDLMLRDSDLKVRFLRAVHFVAEPSDMIAAPDLIAAQLREWRAGRRAVAAPVFELSPDSVAA